MDKCNICESEIDWKAGDTKGAFGILEVSFCVWCYSSMVDMVIQGLSVDVLKDRIKELEG